MTPAPRLRLPDPRSPGRAAHQAASPASAGAERGYSAPTETLHPDQWATPTLCQLGGEHTQVHVHRACLGLAPSSGQSSGDRPTSGSHWTHLSPGVPSEQLYIFPEGALNPQRRPGEHALGNRVCSACNTPTKEASQLYTTNHSCVRPRPRKPHTAS